ncbi:MAG: metallophosphoesterase [Gemmatimonadota bacterium]
MRLVHLSDLHLGYRQYLRLTPTGINQREFDVARTFQRAVDQIIRIEPDLILIAGDVFHTARPSNAAILHAFRQFLRLRKELPTADIVLVAGNHDTPRTTETGSILALFEQLGVHVAASEARSFSLAGGAVSVLAVPGVPGALPALTPGDAKYNVLLVHANMPEIVPPHVAELDRAAINLTRAEIGLSKWSYVALGHYHVHRRVAENAFYSGAIDYTSLNVWGEMVEAQDLGLKGKGFIEFNLETKEHRFHDLAPSRAFVRLPDISARNKSVAELDAEILKAVEKHKGGIDDKIVRLTLRDVPRHVARELDHKALRDFKRRAVHFQMDVRREDYAVRAGQGAPGRRQSVVDVVRDQLTHREIPADLDRERLVDLGLKYLADAEALTVADSALGTET